MTNFNSHLEDMKWEKETVVGLDLKMMEEEYKNIVNMKNDESELYPVTNIQGNVIL